MSNLNYITLLGAEDVQRAASSISSSAATMLSAANFIDSAMYNFRSQIDRLEQLLERAINELPHNQGS